ncbi:MAG: hypothetical protein RIE06_25475 [Roseibium album]|uniref:hypothetical protein n=1 Tax=Roseibium album TaxID=311410 RepID=UPI0032EE19F0
MFIFKQKMKFSADCLTKLGLALFIVLGLTHAIPIKAAFATERLETAIELWLQDNDQQAIPLLADLAANGNEDAALLLGQLEKRSIVFSPYLASMPKSDRTTLLKAPGGGSGVSWLNVLENSNEAAALRKSHYPYYVSEGISDLLDLGELGPATERYWNNRIVGLWEFAAERYFVGDLPDSIRHHAWLAMFYRPESQSDAQNGLLAADFFEALAKQDLQALIALRGLYGRLPPEGRAFVQNVFEVADIIRIFAHEPQFWQEVDKAAATSFAYQSLLNSPQLEKITSVCEDYCPTSKKQCFRAIYYGVGGFEGFGRLQTPVERLIPTKTYFASERYISDILRASYPRFSGIFQSKFKFSKHKFEMELFGSCIVDKILTSSAPLKITD